MGWLLYSMSTRKSERIVPRLHRVWKIGSSLEGCYELTKAGRQSYLLQASRRPHHSVWRVALQLLYLCLDRQPTKEVSNPHVGHVRAEALELVTYLQQVKW